MALAIFKGRPAEVRDTLMDWGYTETPEGFLTSPHNHTAVLLGLRTGGFARMWAEPEDQTTIQFLECFDH